MRTSGRCRYECPAVQHHPAAMALLRFWLDVCLCTEHPLPHAAHLPDPAEGDADDARPGTPVRQLGRQAGRRSAAETVRPAAAGSRCAFGRDRLITFLLLLAKPVSFLCRLLHDDQKESGLLPILARLIKQFDHRWQSTDHAQDLVQCLHVVLRMLERLGREGEAERFANVAESLIPLLICACPSVLLCLPKLEIAAPCPAV